MSIVLHATSEFLKVALFASANTLNVAAVAPEIAVTEPRAAHVKTAQPRLDMQKKLVGISELRRSSDGLFYLDAQVNGTVVRFLVDTGATSIVLTRSDAERSGVMPDAAAFSRAASTAAGHTKFAAVKLDHLVAGPAAQYNVDAAVAGEGLQVSLLGISWLSRLNGVSLEGDRMVLR